MMNPIFDETQPEIKIWRYMDLAKFLYLLDQKALWFCRLDKFEDPFEGYATKLLLEKHHGELTQIYADLQKRGATNVAFYADANRIMNENTLKTMRHRTYANCWHISKHESDAMWKIYSAGNVCSVAIASTVLRLSESVLQELDDSLFKDQKIKKLEKKLVRERLIEAEWDNEDEKNSELILYEQEKLRYIQVLKYFGSVEYTNELSIEQDIFEPTEMGGQKIHALNPSAVNLYRVAFLKRLSFQHEQEYRAVFSFPLNYLHHRMHREDSTKYINVDDLPDGFNITVDLETLITEVVVSPAAPDRFLALIESVCALYQSKYLIPPFKITKSDLLTAPSD